MHKNTPIKILFLAANPRNSSRLRLGEELWKIQERLQKAKARDKFELEQRLAVSPEEFSQAILDIEPQIVHFSGHGTSTEELWLEDESGRISPVSPDALASLFEVVADKVHCVVLNACHSKVQAQAIVKHIPTVIGMDRAIGDRAAIAFSVGFYMALGANYSVEKAYKLGCTTIQLKNIQGEHNIPIIYKNKKLDSKTIEQRNPVNLYLADIQPKLLEQGCLEIRNNVEYEGAIFRSVAKTVSFKISISLIPMGGEAFFIFSEFEFINKNFLRDFSTRCLKYAKQDVDPSSPRENLWDARLPCHVCFAVAIVRELDEETRAHIQKNNPFRDKTDLLWYKIPIIYDLKKKETFFYETRSNFLEILRGEVAWVELRKIVRRVLCP